MKGVPCDCPKGDLFLFSKALFYFFWGSPMFSIQMQSLGCMSVVDRDFDG